MEVEIAHTAEVSEYLKGLEAGDAVLERIDAVLQTLQLLCPESLDDIFVCDQVSDDTGNRLLTSLWAFSPTFAMESRNFLRDDNADLSPYKQSLWYLGIESRDLLLGQEPSEASRLIVELGIGRIAKNVLTASGRNCARLQKIVLERFVPNVRRELL